MIALVLMYIACFNDSISFKYSMLMIAVVLSIAWVLMIALVLSIAWVLMIALVLSIAWVLMIALVLSII